MDKEFEDFLVQKYEKTGVCTHGAQLVALFKRYSDSHEKMLKALGDFEKYVRKIEYLDDCDTLKVADNYRRAASGYDHNTVEWKVYTHTANLFQKKFEKLASRSV